MDTERMGRAATAAVIAPAWVIGPRRFIAWLLLLVGLSIIRLAVIILPRESPVRVFVESVTAGMPTWRDAIRFLLRRGGSEPAPPSGRAPSLRTIHAG